MNDYDNLIKRLRSRAYTGTVRDEAADAIEDLQNKVTDYEARLLNLRKSTPSSGSQKSLQRSGCVSGKSG